MAEITALPQLDLNEFQPPALDLSEFGGPAAPAAPARGALGEIGTGLARGALVDLPTLGGQALKFAGAQGVGNTLTNFGQQMGQKNWLTLHPDQHTGLVNTLAEGAEQIAPVAAVPLAVGGAVAALPFEVPAAIATGAGALAGGALFGAQAGQVTTEKAEAKGVAPDVARTAANLNAAQTFAVQTGLGLVGGKMLGTVGSALGKVIGKEGAGAAEGVLGQLTGSQGSLMPFLKQLPVSAAEAVGLGSTQAAGQAAIEQNAGIDDTTPWQAAKDAIVPMLGLTAAMSPLGLAGRALGVRSAKMRTETLSNPETAPEARAQLADQYAAALSKANPEAAAAFRANAETAITSKQALPVDPSLFTPGTIQKPYTPPQLPAPTLRLGQLPAGTEYTFPDGSKTNNFADVESYLNELPPEQQDAARAKIFGFEPSKQAAIAPSATPEAATAVTDSVDALHGQVQSALAEGGIEPAAPMTRQEFAEKNGIGGQRAIQEYQAYLNDPATGEAVMRENIAKYEQMQKPAEAPAETTAAEAPRAEPSTESSAPEQFNTQLSDQLQGALRQRQVDQAYAALDAQRTAETAAIANRTHGEELAAAAARGEVQPDANAPKSKENVTADLATVNAANGFDTKAQSMVPFMKRLDSLGLDGMASHQDQIRALETYMGDTTNKMSDAVRDRMNALLDHWKQETPTPEAVAPEATKAAETPIEAAAPAQAAALGENIPTPAPDNAAPPTHTETLGENIEPSVREHAQAAADKLDETIAGFNARIRSGETLSPLEQERYEDAQGFRKTLAAINSPSGGQHDDAYIKDITSFAKQTEQPYTKSQRLPMLRMDNPEAVDPGLMAPAIASHNLSDILTHLATNGSEPQVREVAQRLNDLGITTKIYRGGPNGEMAGSYSRSTDTVMIYPGGESEQTILHEATHAGISSMVDRAAAIITPRSQAEAKLKRAYDEWEKIRLDALKKTGANDQYGLTDAHEFGAELMSNSAFQQFLKDQGTQKSLWDRAVDAVRNMFGLPVDSRGALEKAMAAAEVFFGGAKNEREFDASPERAGKVTDDVLHSFLKSADGLKDKVDFGTANLKVFRTFLGAQTVQYIADRARAVPELVRSGFSQGVDAYQAAHRSRTLAAEHIESTNGKYVHGVQQLLNKLGDGAKARDMSMQLMRLGGESSIGQFDYKMNYADNKKAHPDLDPKNKGFIDDMHREFTQLQRTNPEAAKSLVEGEKLNRKMLVTRVATIIANTMDARAGATRRLEAELTRMAPDDAARVALEARLANARQEGQLAAVHSRGLDFMSKDLQGARNGDTTMHYDGPSSALAARVDAAFAAAKALPEGTPLRAHLAELENMYRPQYRNPYFSLGRDGNYFVNIGFKPGMDAATAAKIQDALKGTNKVAGNLTGGATHMFFRVDSMDQAAGLRRKLEQAGGDRIDMTQNAHGLLADRDMVNSSGVSPALRQMLASLHDEVDNNPGIKADQALAMKEAVTRQLLSMLPETSSRSAQMQRRGIPGYDGDFVGNFSRRASGGVQDISHMYTAPAFAAAQKQMSDSISGLNRTGSADAKQRAQMVADEINTRYANGMKPVSADVINRINSLGHSFYLALNPAFYIRTMAQPFHRGVPILGARYGFVKAAKEQAVATGTAMKVIANTIKTGWDEGGARGVLDGEMQFKDMGLTKPEEAFVQEMHDRGKLNLGQAQQLQRLATGGSQRTQDLVRFASMTAQYAEMTNRLATGLAAFRLAARDPKMTHEAAVDYADQTIDRAMDNFDSNNTARWLSKQGPLGKVTPLMTAFMNYNLQTMQQITRTVHDGLFNRDPSPAGLQRAKEARREFAGLMATTTMISGVMGLPFANAFAGVYNMLTKDQDDPSDIRTSTRKFLADTFGDQAGGALAHGAGSLIGMDTSTFGLENLLPGSEFLASRQKFQDRVESQSQQLLGPALNAGIDVGLALSKMSDGYYVKGIEQALPSGLKAPYKAVELATNGYTDSKGNPLPIKATGWDVALQAAGFRSSTRAEQSENQMDFNTNQQLLQHRRQVISDQMFKAITSGDQEAVQSGQEAMLAFNAKNPTQPIRGIADVIRTHMQEFAVGQNTGTGVMAGARRTPILQRDYAAMPEK